MIKIRRSVLSGILLGCSLSLALAETPTSHAPEAKPTALEQSGPAASDYRIGLGDVLQISVWREPDASVPTAAVRADGKISMPLVKEVEVVGLTAAQAENLLSQKLSRYILGANVTVIVKEVHSRKAYLTGAVRMVGAIDLRGQLTVMQALTQAGGLTDYAKRKQIYVLRNENGKQAKLPFNYDLVIKGENMEQNIVLAPNDMIVVPQ
jgi:polysaccharide export outer membrane protein